MLEEGEARDYRQKETQDLVKLRETFKVISVTDQSLFLRIILNCIEGRLRASDGVDNLVKPHTLQFGKCSHSAPTCQLTWPTWVHSALSWPSHLEENPTRTVDLIISEQMQAHARLLNLPFQIWTKEGGFADMEGGTSLHGPQEPEHFGTCLPYHPFWCLSAPCSLWSDHRTLLWAPQTHQVLSGLRVFTNVICPLNLPSLRSAPSWEVSWGHPHWHPQPIKISFRTLSQPGPAPYFAGTSRKWKHRTSCPTVIKKTTAKHLTQHRALLNTGLHVTTQISCRRSQPCLRHDLIFLYGIYNNWQWKIVWLYVYIMSASPCFYNPPV